MSELAFFSGLTASFTNLPPLTRQQRKNWRGMLRYMRNNVPPF